MTTADDRLRAGYAEPSQKRDDRRLAAGYRPEFDDEAERLREIDDMPTLTRMSLGYHNNAREARDATTNGDAA